LIPQEQHIAIANDFWAAGRRKCLAAELPDPALRTAKCRQESLYLVVPGERIELPTNGLQNRCSTAELTRHFKYLTFSGHHLGTENVRLRFTVN
jgi:hypothetical protein